VAPVRGSGCGFLQRGLHSQCIECWDGVSALGRDHAAALLLPVLLRDVAKGQALQLGLMRELCGTFERSATEPSRSSQRGSLSSAPSWVTTLCKAALQFRRLAFVRPTSEPLITSLFLLRPR